jgi:type IV pilus assembly protein PilN
MIRINLTRRRCVQKIKRARNQALFTSLLLGLFVLTLSVHNTSLGARVEKINAAAAEQKKSSDQLFKIKKKMTLLKKKEAVISDLVNARGSQIRVLDAIARSVPKKAWLIQVQINEDIVSIRGKAMESSDAAIFMSRLKQTALFSDVHLKRLTQEARPEKQLTLSVFELTCRRVAASGSKNEKMDHA